MMATFYINRRNYNMVGVDSKESHNYKFLLHTKNRYLPKYKAPANKHPLLLQTPMDPQGHVEQKLFSTLLPEVALNPSKPVKTAPVLMPPQLELWRTGVS